MEMFISFGNVHLKATLNKWVFKLFLNMLTDSAFLIETGSPFHIDGAACKKDILLSCTYYYYINIRAELEY